MGLINQIKNTILSKPYFLVIGAGRGGTSLLTAMLDYNSHLEVALERFSFDYLLGQKMPPEKAKMLDKRLTYFQKACQDDANLSSHYWGNKITTEQIIALQECDGAIWPEYLDSFIMEVIGLKRVVYIVRDGRSCVQSKMKRTGQDYETALARWKGSIAVLDHFSKRNVDMHVCRYEDLVNEPGETLQDICKFLNVKFEEQMLKGPQNPIMPAIYAGEAIRQKPQTKTNWPERWTEDMKEELLKLGYLDEN